MHNPETSLKFASKSDKYSKEGFAMDFEKAFEIVVGHEGGFTDNPKDRGNWTSGKVGVGQLNGTKYGISAMAYPDLDIRRLTVAQAREIYKADYWDKIRGDELPGHLAYNVFDGAVNSGVTRSIRWLQEAVGANPDGVIGPRTLASVASTPEALAIARYNGHRLMFITDTATWSTFGKGWAKRIASNLIG
jgi:lysozyme family protein